jgi:hypothetical protein
MMGRRELPAWWREFNGREMPLGPYMMHSVVRIIGDKRNRKTGALERKALGTGFYVRIPSETHAEAWYGYVVTAHHVIDGQPNVDLVFPDPTDPGKLYPTVETDGPDWRQPIENVDLAVLPFLRPEGYWINALEMGRNILPSLPGPALLAMPFHYVGLLEPLDRPMARSGTLGAIYQAGIEHADGYEYTAHLGDCRSYGGFSGSPCFLEIAMAGLTEAEPPFPQHPSEADLGLVAEIKYGHTFCGMVTWHLEPPKDREESSIFGVVCILPNDYIWGALMSDDYVQKRREADELPDEPEAVPTNVSSGRHRREGRPEESQGDYERFDALASAIVQVPKSEIDAKRKQDR